MSRVVAESVEALPRFGARRTIAVGLDGSEAAKRALDWAVEHAALTRSELVVVGRTPTVGRFVPGGPDELRALECDTLVVGSRGEPFHGLAAAAENPERQLVVVRGLPLRTGVVTAAVGGVSDRAVLRAAAQICRARSARLRLLHLHLHFGGVAEAGEPDDTPLRRATAYLRAMAPDLEPTTLLDRRAPHEAFGAPATDLLVIGRGYGGTVGRVAKTAFYHSACPVVLA
ncbi:universal stress protein [Actinosynnema sp. CA-248983]